MKSIYIFLIILVGLSLVVSILASGVSVFYFLHYYAFLAIAVPSFLMLRASFTFKEMIEAFKAPDPKNSIKKCDVKNALVFFKAFRNCISISATVASLIGIIAILSDLRSSKLVASGISVALLCVLYALIINLIIIIPFKASLNKKLNYLEND